MLYARSHHERPGEVVVEQRPLPVIQKPTDAVIKLAATCICGSDLWPYRGIRPVDHEAMGHEYVGEVVEVGAAVTSVKPVTLWWAPSAPPVASAKSARPATPHAASAP